ncbi:hypothetical protein ATCC90586_006666 [Pythium insidiosum]|nr:hypothetical protein ATCC90586_006666 [Pythium insidiosum]
MSLEASKKAAKELIALCEKEGVKLPTNPVNAMVEAGTMLNATKENNPVNAMVEAGTMLNATKENGEFQLEKALKRGERFKGGTWSKVAKAIRDHDEKITSGKQAQKLKGIGKSAAAKIDEFLESGSLEQLEEYRAGNL